MKTKIKTKTKQFILKVCICGVEFRMAGNLCLPKPNSCTHASAYTLPAPRHKLPVVTISGNSRSKDDMTALVFFLKAIISIK